MFIFQRAAVMCRPSTGLNVGGSESIKIPARREAAVGTTATNRRSSASLKNIKVRIGQSVQTRL